jgi:hypothetical protein
VIVSESVGSFRFAFLCPLGPPLFLVQRAVPTMK